MTSWTVIANPAAGGGRAGKQIADAVAALQAEGLTLDVRHTERAGHASELAREAQAAGATQFIAVGGDGTVFEVCNGLFPLPDGAAPPTLAQLPLGTGNSFLQELSYADSAGAIAAIAGGKTRPVDVVRCEHAEGQLHYINILSVGFSAQAGSLTNRRFKWLGHRGYSAAVVFSLCCLRYPRFGMTLDAGDPDDRPCTLLSFSNSRYTGGTMLMAPPAAIDDGKLDLVFIGPLSSCGLLRAFPRLFKGTHVDLDVVQLDQARVVTFAEGDPVDVMVDGEVISLALRRLEVLPGALQVIA